MRGVSKCDGEDGGVRKVLGNDIQGGSAVSASAWEINLGVHR